MADERETRRGKQKKTMEKAGMLLGAAGLLLFIVGVKRRHRIDDGIEVGPPPPRRRAAREEAEDVDVDDEERDDEA